MLSTRHKMAIARGLNRAILGARRLAGRGSSVEATRRGIRWRLDLDEGVDLAIYLNLYQTIPSRVLDNWVRPGSLMVDIGANIGAMSLLIANNCGPDARVVSIEPTDFAFAKLLANATLNPELKSRIIPIQAALTDGASPGSQEVPQFYSRWPVGQASGPRHERHEGQFEAASQARFVALDALLDGLRSSNAIRGAVSFMKLDVDGYELTVLKGGSQTIARDKPPILIEIAPHVQDEVAGRFEELVGVLRDHGYTFEDAATGSALPQDAAGLRAHVPHGAGFDALARVR